MKYFLIGVVIFWSLTVVLIIHHEHSTVGIRDREEFADRTEIVFWHAMGGPLGRVMDGLIREYNNQSEKYFVRAVNMGNYGTLQQKVLASLVANEAPDISQNYETLTLRFIRNNRIVNLDKLLASETEDIKADIIPIMLENNTFYGKVYSFPFNKSVPVLYYNKEMFAAAGLDPERPPETLDELVEFSRIIRDHFHKEGRRNVYGYGVSRANVWSYLNRVLQFGGEIVTEDFSESLFHKEPAVEALRFHQNMIKEGIARESQGFDHQSDFLAGTAAIIEASIVSKLFMEPDINFDFGVAPLPRQERNAAILSGTNVNIFDNGDPEKILGAWDFIKWFTSTDVTARWSIKTTYMPVRKSALETNYFLQALKDDPNLEAPYIQLDYCHFEPRISAWFEIRDLVSDHLERATIEMGPPEEHTNAMKQDADALLRHATR